MLDLDKTRLPGIEVPSHRYSLRGVLKESFMENAVLNMEARRPFSRLRRMMGKRRSAAIAAAAIALTVVIIVVTIVIDSATENAVSAEEIARNASDTIDGFQSAHIRIFSESYCEGQLYLISEEETWIEYPNRLSSTVIETNPHTGQPSGKRVMKCNGEDLYQLTFDNAGSLNFASTTMNIIHYPSGDFGVNYVLYGLYQTPVDCLLLDTSNFSIVGKEKIGSRDVIKIKEHVTPTGQDEEEITYYMYVDPDTSVVLRREGYCNGVLASRTDVKSFEMNVDMDESIFECEIPEGFGSAEGTYHYFSDCGYTILEDTDELRSRISFHHVLPSYLPEGYRLCETGYVDNSKVIVDGRPQEPNPIWVEPSFFVFSNGDRYIYMAQDALAENQKGHANAVVGIPLSRLRKVDLSNGVAYLYPIGDRSGTLYFEAGNVKVRLTGSVNLDELKRMAESIVESSRQT